VHAASAGHTRARLVSTLGLATDNPAINACTYAMVHVGDGWTSAGTGARRECRRDGEDAPLVERTKSRTPCCDAPTLRRRVTNEEHDPWACACQRRYWRAPSILGARVTVCVRHPRAAMPVRRLPEGCEAVVRRILVGCPGRKARAVGAPAPRVCWATASTLRASRLFTGLRCTAIRRDPPRSTISRSWLQHTACW
jgi:hypothetical protein